MRVIIAGGTGLIGKELTSALINAGDEVTVLSRSPRRIVGMPTGVKLVAWDGKTPQDWVQYINGATAVVNLTGENLAGEGFFPSRWTDERKLRIMQSRIDAGKAIAAAIAATQNKPLVYVQASSIGFYGAQEDKPLTEEDGSGTDFLAKVSREWEASSVSIEAMGVRRVIIRTGVVLTAKGGAFPRLLLPYRLFIGGPFGNGRQVLSWIHLADEVNAIRFLIENNTARGVFNLTAPNPVSNNEFGKMIGHIMRRPHYLPIPGFLMRMAFGEVSTVVLDGQRVLPKRLLDAGFEFRYALLEDALRNLLDK